MGKFLDTYLEAGLDYRVPLGKEEVEKVLLRDLEDEQIAKMTIAEHGPSLIGAILQAATKDGPAILREEKQSFKKDLMSTLAQEDASDIEYIAKKTFENATLLAHMKNKQAIVLSSNKVQEAEKAAEEEAKHKREEKMQEAKAAEAKKEAAAEQPSEDAASAEKAEDAAEEKEA